MFKSKIIISTIIFLFFLIITSIIKNQTRILEKELYKLNKKISFQARDINESQLDFYFLSSPAQIEKKIKILDQNDYLPIKSSKVFLIAWSEPAVKTIFLLLTFNFFANFL